MNLQPVQNQHPDTFRTLCQKSRTLPAKPLIPLADTREADTFRNDCPDEPRAIRASHSFNSNFQARTKCPDSSNFPCGGHSLPSLEGSVPRRKEMKTIRSAAEKFDRQNLESAAIILNDPVRFPPGSGGETWARLFMARMQGKSMAGDPR